jgi:hypothetical protein
MHGWELESRGGEGSQEQDSYEDAHSEGQLGHMRDYITQKIGAKKEGRE